MSELIKYLKYLSQNWYLQTESILKNAKEFFCEDRIIVTEELNDSEIFEETIEESKAKILETDVLYVLFTSGSTGVPKGVVTPHKAITSYIVALVSDYKMDDTYVLGVQSSVLLCYDSS